MSLKSCFLLIGPTGSTLVTPDRSSSPRATLLVRLHQQRLVGRVVVTATTAVSCGDLQQSMPQRSASLGHSFVQIAEKQQFVWLHQTPTSIAVARCRSVRRCSTTRFQDGQWV
jgi:hypothetical protein